MGLAAEAFNDALAELGIDEKQLDAKGFGRRAALLAASDILWARHLGPAYSTRQVCEMFGSSKQAVSDRVRRGTLLALPSDGGEVTYPAFQFGPDGQPLPGVPEVIAALRDVVQTPHTIAAWLVAPDVELAGSTPVEELRLGRSKIVAEVAQHYAARLQQ
jgi:hypothetical protein